MVVREPENPPQIAPDRVTSEASIRLLRNLTESLNRAAPVPLPEQHTFGASAAVEHNIFGSCDATFLQNLGHLDSPNWLGLAS